MGYTPTKKNVSIPRPKGTTAGNPAVSNAPTKTQAHVAVAGKNRVSIPSETSGARGGHAVSTGTGNKDVRS